MPAPSPPPLPPDDNYFLTNTKFDEIVIKEKTEKVIKNINNALNEIPDPPKIEDVYVNDKVLNEKNIEDIKDEYNFEEIKRCL